MQTELLDNNGDIVTEQPETKVIKYSVTDAGIAKLKEKYKEVPADLAIKENYELVKKAASHIRGLRGDVEKRRKGLKAKSLAYGKLVDSTAKEIITRLKAIEEPYSTAKKDFDTAVEIAKREAALAEEKRVDDIAERITLIKSRVEKHFSNDSETISIAIESTRTDLPCEWADEFREKADIAVTDTIEKLKELHAMKIQQETFAAQQAEAEAARIKKEEDARKQREIDAEAERVKIAAEREAMEEERLKMKSERDKLAREAEELAAKQKAEQDKKDAIAKAEQDKKDAAQELINAEIAAYAEQAERDQAVKDAEAEAEKTKMAAEIEALKKANEPVVVQEVVNEVSMDKSLNSQEKEAEEKVQEHDSTITIPVPEEDYKATGQAMIKYIGNRKVTKDLLDAIVNNEVPNIKFTGEV